MHSQTYISDPNIWETFYKNMANNTFSPYKYRKKSRNTQIGRGLSNRYRGSYIIPVNPNAVREEVQPVTTTLVSPVAAAQERAVSENKDQKRDREPRVQLMKHIKKRTPKKKFIRKRSTKRNTHQRKASSKKSKHTEKPAKQKLTSEYYDSVWNQAPKYKPKRR